MHKYEKRHNCSGFTLVEVLIALAILSFGILGVASMTTLSITQDSTAYYLGKANLAVEEFLENATQLQYSSATYGNIAGGNFTVDKDNSNQPVYTVTCVLDQDTPENMDKQMTCTITNPRTGRQVGEPYIYVYAPKWGQ